MVMLLRGELLAYQTPKGSSEHEVWTAFLKRGDVT